MARSGNSISKRERDDLANMREVVEKENENSVITLLEEKRKK